VDGIKVFSERRKSRARYDVSNYFDGGKRNVFLFRRRIGPLICVQLRMTLGSTVIPSSFRAIVIVWILSGQFKTGAGFDVCPKSRWLW